MYFAILYKKGPAWVEGLSIYEQDLYEHSLYVDRLHKEGLVLMGGPFRDESGGMTILKTSTTDEATAILQHDPAVLNGVFSAELHDWHVVFDLPANNESPGDEENNASFSME